MLLGNVGESDRGLMQFARGCKNLQKLELRGCCFSEQALARAVLEMPLLRYLWVQGYKASRTGNGLLAMARPFWNMELIRPCREIVDCDADRCQSLLEMTNFALDRGRDFVDSQAQVLAYYSLAGKRSDYPESVTPLSPA